MVSCWTAGVQVVFSKNASVTIRFYEYGVKLTQVHNPSWIQINYFLIQSIIGHWTRSASEGRRTLAVVDDRNLCLRKCSWWLDDVLCLLIFLCHRWDSLVPWHVFYCCTVLSVREKVLLVTVSCPYLPPEVSLQNNCTTLFQWSFMVSKRKKNKHVSIQDWPYDLHLSSPTTKGL